jgi:hypothetical protein
VGKGEAGIYPGSYPALLLLPQAVFVMSQGRKRRHIYDTPPALYLLELFTAVKTTLLVRKHHVPSKQKSSFTIWPFRGKYLFAVVARRRAMFVYQKLFKT